MSKVTNETLRKIVESGSDEGLIEPSQLLPVSGFVQSKSISQELYAAALTKADLTRNALAQLDILQTIAVGTAPELLADITITTVFRRIDREQLSRYYRPGKENQSERPA